MVGATVGTQTFLALDEPFLPNPIRTAPRVWLEHVRIFAAADRELRRLKLTPGLNVIWAPDASPDERVGTRIGHGAGKTLLCRFLRHVLGEPDLASPGDADALRHTFPEGFIEAEVHVDGVRWAVRRPFDATAESFAVCDAELAALDRPEQRVPYDAFLEALQATLGPSAEMLAGDPWLAALAWMSRDQERRFGGALHWRDRTASSNSKVARVANVERVRAMRSFLRLRAAEDVAAEQAVAELEVDERTTIRQLADCEREVTWLSIRLAREGVGDVSELAGQPLVLRAAIAELTAKLDALDAPREEPEALRTARDAYEAALREEAVQQAIVNEHQALLESLRAHEAGTHDASCGHCHAPFSFEPGAARTPTARAERDLVKEQKSHAKAARKLERARTALQKAIDRERAAQRSDWLAWADARERLARAKELERQVQRRDELSARLARIQTDLSEARIHRDRTIREHGKRARRVSDVFDFVIRRLAGQDVSGKVSIGATELDAGIRLPDGRAGTSPALRVLETLALDLSALVLACEDRADLPGLLIHDSPREADLARSHYDALYRLATWLEDATNSPGFQYIVTTTTSPPKSLAFRAVRLGAIANDDLLLRTPLSL